MLPPELEQYKQALKAEVEAREVYADAQAVCEHLLADLRKAQTSVLNARAALDAALYAE